MPIGANDELFIAGAYPEAFRRYAPAIPVETVAGVGHMGMVVDPAAAQAVVAAARVMIAPAHEVQRRGRCAVSRETKLEISRLA